MASIRDGEVVQMSTATADVSTAHHFVTKIENAEAKRKKKTVNKVRPDVARKLQTAPGTLENIRRLRSKVIPNWLMERIRAEFVSVLQSEIQGLEHEVHLARQIGAHHSDDTLASAEAQLAAARQILMGEVK